MTDYNSILAAAFNMPVSDRLRLIDELAATVPDDQPPALSPQWLAEIERRSTEIDSGSATTQPWSDVRQQLFSQAGLKRAD
jgi:putative addiction module component (TIGR02574 family)